MKIKICIGTPCHLMGAQNLISAVERYQQKNDLNLDIEAVSCLDQCEEAPAVEIDGQIHAPATPQELIDLIANSLPSQN